MYSVSIYNPLKLNLITSKILLALFIFMLTFIQSGCQKMDSTQKDTDDAIIQSYLLKKNITAIKTSS